MHQLNKIREPNHIPMIKVNILLVDDAVQVKVLLWSWMNNHMKKMKRKLHKKEKEEEEEEGDV